MWVKPAARISATAACFPGRPLELPPLGGDHKFLMLALPRLPLHECNSPYNHPLLHAAQLVLARTGTAPHTDASRAENPALRFRRGVRSDVASSWFLSLPTGLN